MGTSAYTVTLPASAGGPPSTLRLPLSISARWRMSSSGQALVAPCLVGIDGDAIVFDNGKNTDRSTLDYHINLAKPRCDGSHSASASHTMRYRAISISGRAGGFPRYAGFLDPVANRRARQRTGAHIGEGPAEDRACPGSPGVERRQDDERWTAPRPPSPANKQYVNEP